MCTRNWNQNFCGYKDEEGICDDDDDDDNLEFVDIFVEFDKY